MREGNASPIGRILIPAFDISRVGKFPNPPENPEFSILSFFDNPSSSKIPMLEKRVVGAIGDVINIGQGAYPPCALQAMRNILSSC